MNLLPILPKPPHEAASKVIITCVATKKKAEWNAAAEQGWVFDTEGKAFVAYYSPEGVEWVKQHGEPDDAKK